MHKPTLKQKYWHLNNKKSWYFVCFLFALITASGLLREVSTSLTSFYRHLGPLLPAYFLQLLQVAWFSFAHYSLPTMPHIFKWDKIWWLARQDKLLDTSFSLNKQPPTGTGVLDNCSGTGWILYRFRQWTDEYMGCRKLSWYRQTSLTRRPQSRWN